MLIFATLRLGERFLASYGTHPYLETDTGLCQKKWGPVDNPDPTIDETV